MNIFMRRMMDSLGHLSDEAVCLLLNDELSSVREVRVRAHLANCWQCRLRYEQLERAAHQVVEYRRTCLLPKVPKDRKRREAFLAKIDQMMTAAPVGFFRLGFNTLLWTAFRLLRPASGNPHSQCKHRLRSFDPQRTKDFGIGSKVNPVWVTVAVTVFALALVFLIWQRTAVPVSAAGLLDRAETSDAGLMGQSGAGVVYQRVRISTAHRTLERAVLRDGAGHRHPALEAVNAGADSAIEPSTQLIKANLELAGVQWEDPLSAQSYKNWHDRQALRTDQVRRFGNNLLTLTTTTPNAAVAWQSLTVRENDFHPVKRTVELRGEEPIEIAEINFAVLDWDALHAALFTPPPASLLPSAPAHVPVPILGVIGPMLPTATQLDDAELQARLVLSRVGADIGEQIRIVRTSARVEVEGLVETNSRKREISDQLSDIPGADSSLLSVEELANSSSEPPATLVKGYSVTAQPSPLGQYAQETNLSADDMSAMSARLLDASLKVQRNAISMSELLQRFAAPEQLSPESRSAWNELVGHHEGGITAGLDDEQGGLLQLGFGNAQAAQPKPLTNGASVATSRSEDATPIKVGQILEELATEARQNQALCRELIAGGDEAVSRPAPAVAGDLLNSINRIRNLVSQLPLADR